MTNEQKIFLEFLKIGIGKNTNYKIIQGANWQEVYKLSIEQQVTAIVLDGINRCYENRAELDIEFQTKMDWIGTAQQVEDRYRYHEAVIRQLAQFYQKHGINMMLLKGYGLSLNYPIPKHRAPGDIDIYLFGDYEKGDKLVENVLGIKVDKSHHHHTIFTFQGECVENHYDFLNVYVRRSNKRIEKKLKRLAVQGVTNDEDVLTFPSVSFNAIFLLRHCAAHFASTEITIRQVLDWGLFMEKHHKEIKWDEYIPYIKQEGMFRFYNLLGLFCTLHLGFDASIFNGLCNDDIFERFSNEIISPEFEDRENGKLLHSLSVKPRRWWHNRWKNRLCYTDNALSEFAYGLWAKVLKPSHFWQ